jgi:cobalt/nickel transport system permease protein
MACVLIVQCLVFQDGGITALGANVLNMGLVACFMGYYLYQAVVSLMGESRRSTLVGGFVGAWASVFLASIACVIELAVSGRSPLGVALPAMAGVHALIGIGEGLITTAVLAFVTATRADLLKLQKV